MNFKVGEVCIGQNLVNEPEYNGKECTILVLYEKGSYRWDKPRPQAWDPNEYDAARVSWFDGTERIVRTRNLRRKPPKSDDTEWAKSKVQDLLNTLGVPA